MAVETPQLEMPVYQEPATQIQQQPQAAQPQVLPAQAGYVPKAGAAAFIANSVIDGWLKGRQVRAQNQLRKAQTQVQGADYAYKALSDNYNNLLRSGKSETDPEVQKAKQAAVSAWQAKLNVMQQYAMPQEPQKKTTKQKVEGGFGQLFGKSGITPQLIAQGSLDVLRNSPPPGLGLTPQDRLTMTQEQLATEQLKGTKTSNEEAKLKLDTERQSAAEDAKMRSIVSTPETERTPEQKQWLQGWERVQHIKDPKSQQFADSVMTKIMGGQQLTDTERNFAYSQRLLEAPQTIQYQDNLTTKLARIDADGKMIGTPITLGRVFHEDQAAVAVRQFQLLHKARVQDLVKAGMKSEEAEKLATVEESRNPQYVASFIGDDPGQTEQHRGMLDRALRSVFAEAGGAGADTATKKRLTSEWSNFVVLPQQNDSTGLYMFRDQIAPPTMTGGFLGFGKKPVYAGGMTPEEENTVRAGFYNRVRAQLQKQNPKLNAHELDQIIPQWLKTGTPPPQQQSSSTSGGSAASRVPRPTAWGMLPPPFGPLANVVHGIRAMTAPPSQNQPSADRQGVFGEKTPTSKVYTVHLKEGDERWYLTPEDAASAQQQGVALTPAQ